MNVQDRTPESPDTTSTCGPHGLSADQADLDTGQEEDLRDLLRRAAVEHGETTDFGVAAEFGWAA